MWILLIINFSGQLIVCVYSGHSVVLADQGAVRRRHTFPLAHGRQHHRLRRRLDRRRGRRRGKQKGKNRVYP